MVGVGIKGVGFYCTLLSEMLKDAIAVGEEKEREKEEEEKEEKEKNEKIRRKVRGGGSEATTKHTLCWE